MKNRLKLIHWAVLASLALVAAAATVSVMKPEPAPDLLEGAEITLYASPEGQIRADSLTVVSVTSAGYAFAAERQGDADTLLVVLLSPDGDSPWQEDETIAVPDGYAPITGSCRNINDKVIPIITISHVK